MSLIKGKVCSFSCQTTSLFHTSRQQYATLVKCAPFILGSTIRGAMLKDMIEREGCPHLAQLETEKNSCKIRKIHLSCDRKCSVKPFFLSPPQAFFSFGEFEPKEEKKGFYSSSTRIAINRCHNSVSEGAMEKIEAIIPETPFQFSLTLFGESLEVSEEAKASIRMLADGTGLGRFKSIGYGRFKIVDVKEKDFGEVVEEKTRKIKEIVEEKKRVQLLLTTPLVLGDGENVHYPINEREVLGKKIGEDIKEGLKGIIDEPLSFPIQEVEACIRPDFISRFSYESGRRENRLVAWKDSRITFSVNRVEERQLEQLAVASLLGIGDWREWGFGRFEVERS
ncbi:MAG: RAMP superfamily CRISPR-associated protein [bacterium]